MTAAASLALIPILLVALLAVVLMMLSAFFRDDRLVAWTYQMGLALSLLTVLGNVGGSIQGVEVTPLLQIDQLFRFFAVLFILVTMVVGQMMGQYLHQRRRLDVPVAESYVLLTICLLGALVLAAARHFAALFIGLELMSIASFALVAYPCGALPQPDSRPQLLGLEAGLKYLLLSSVASAFLLFGIACLYLQSGSLAFAVPDGLPEAGPWGAAGLALLLIGIAFKLALVPFHMWSPDVYQGAPTPIAALIATLSKSALVAVVLRYLVVGQALQQPAVPAILAGLAVLSILGGNLLALQQRDIKRLLAYSSIAHLGYLLVVLLAAGEAVSSELALQAGGFYLLAYSLTTLGAFAIVNSLAGGEDDAAYYRIDHYEGLLWRSPWLGACFVLVLLSLAGIPLTAGFIGKFYLFAAGARAELWWLLGLVTLGSAIGLYYYAKIMLIMMRPGEGTLSVAGHWLIVGLTLLLVLLGIYPLPILHWLPML